MELAKFVAKAHDGWGLLPGLALYTAVIIVHLIRNQDLKSKSASGVLNFSM